jgi:hypothetical protein
MSSAATPSTAAIAVRASAGQALRNSRAPATHSIVWSARPRIKGGMVKQTVT